jgi:hypothetical protein
MFACCIPGGGAVPGAAIPGGGARMYQYIEEMERHAMKEQCILTHARRSSIGSIVRRPAIQTWSCKIELAPYTPRDQTLQNCA